MPTLPYDDQTILSVFEPLALEAGRRIMDICRQGFRTEEKADHSPVTRADREAEAIILSGLRTHFPDIPVVAEEESAAGLRPRVDGDVFFLVDPLDGTKEFVAGKGDFTVNIALVRGGEPVVGVVYAPALNTFYSGRPGRAEAAGTDSGHQLVERRAIAVRRRKRPPIIVASRSHRTPETDAYIARFADAKCVTVGSSLKFCLVAAGEADIYPRMSRTMQWDVAAGDAVLRAAGGTTRMLDGRPYRYGPGVVKDDDPFASPYFVSEGLPAEL
ncbi:3'(2'),5'-bisphosphate nucleotidase CysQ [Mesorhizobium sp. CAU 1741]|uniref:3'(2'),5'-bisphosphate nucleotidase CysQ n=1 Tax=Mesorhizobium sp. CAU 1741 TaxID=3140366 RepID=UPI00325B6EA3